MGPDDWILFTVQTNTNDCFKVRTDKIRSDGSDRTQLSDGGPSCTPQGFEQSGDADPCWSADGTTLYTSRGIPSEPNDAPAGVGITERKLVSFSSDAWSPQSVETDLSLAAAPDCIEGVPKASPDGEHLLVYRVCFGADGQPDEPGVYLADTDGKTRSFAFAGFGADCNPVAPVPSRRPRSPRRCGRPRRGA